MEVFLIILGVLMALCGCSCMFEPIITFLQLGDFLMILLILYGIAGVMRCTLTKEYGMNLVFSILSIIGGIVFACVPGLRGATDGLILYIMVGWFIIRSILSIVLSLKIKEVSEDKQWIWGMVLGILGILVGIYLAFHPVVVAFMIGVLIGVYFMVTGIEMIITGVQANKGAPA